LDRAVFGEPADSPYVLPYPVGEAYEVITSYCSSFTFPDNIGLDFDLPMGSRLVAARPGVAIEVVDGFDDGGASLDQNNFILIQHGDGSVAFYSHVRQGSARIQTGDSVGVGDRIADSGAAGAPFAHLHFTVYRNAGLDDRDSLPINFRNADGPLDERGGLIPGQVYRALPF
jgi:murein DD-endopeptidase MepM/ murein hydrolase activator NlpD